MQSTKNAECLKGNMPLVKMLCCASHRDYWKGACFCLVLCTAMQRSGDLYICMERAGYRSSTPPWTPGVIVLYEVLAKLYSKLFHVASGIRSRYPYLPPPRKYAVQVGFLPGLCRMFTSLDAVETDLRTVIGGSYRLFPIMSYEEARSTTAATKRVPH